MSIIIGGNTLAATDFNATGETGNNISFSTRGLILNYDAGNLNSLTTTSNYYDCGYGCQYYASAPSCTNCNTQWRDISGYGLDGTLTNGATFNSAGGGSVYFDATNDYVTAASSSQFAFGTGDFTLECWIYPQSFSTYTHMIALPHQDTFALKANVSDGAIYFYSSAWTSYGYTSGWTLAINTWQQVIFKRESSTGYAYLNGDSKGSRGSFTNNFTAQVLNIHNGYSGGEMAECKMAIIRIYNRALTSDEITNNFNNGRQRFGL